MAYDPNKPLSQITPEELATFTPEEKDAMRKRAAEPVAGPGAPAASGKGLSPEEAEHITGIKSNEGGIISGIGNLGNDTFSQEEVVAPTVNEKSFQRQPDAQATKDYVAAGAKNAAQGQTSLDAATAGANQQRAQGTQAAQTAAGLATGQRAQGDQALASQQSLASGLQGQGMQAANRDVAGRAREQQYQALGGLKQFQQQGPGPSAAEVQLKQGADASMGQALALARSGRAGTNPAAERQAMFQNAATMQGLNQSQALLRAQEGQQFRNQQLQSMGMEQQALQGLGNQAIQAQGLNDQTALGYTNAANQAAALGYNAAQGFGGLANQTQGQGQQYDVALQGAANQQQGLGQQMFLGAGGLEQQANELAEKARMGDRDAAMALEKLKADYAFQTSVANAGFDASRDAGNAGMMMGALKMLGGSSDARSKTRIRELEGELASAYKALGGKPESRSVSGPNDFDGTIYRRYPGDKDAQTSRELDAAMKPTYEALSGAPATAGVPKGGDPSTDLRGAKGYAYEYKNPNAPGAAPGTQYGPMAQDLEKNPATAASVVNTPNGKMVDAAGLTMTNTAAIGEQQRKADEQQSRIADLEKQVKAMGGDPDKPGKKPENDNSGSGWDDMAKAASMWASGGR